MPWLRDSECHGVSDGLYVCRLITLRALLHVKADLLVLLQRFEAFCLNHGEVRKQVLATSSGAVNPKAFTSLNHFTVQVGT
jgi:hypothetical protein